MKIQYLFLLYELIIKNCDILELKFLVVLLKEESVLINDSVVYL